MQINNELWVMENIMDFEKLENTELIDALVMGATKGLVSLLKGNSRESSIHEEALGRAYLELMRRLISSQMDTERLEFLRENCYGFGECDGRTIIFDCYAIGKSDSPVVSRFCYKDMRKTIDELMKNGPYNYEEDVKCNK